MYQEVYSRLENIISPRILEYDDKGNIINKSNEKIKTFKNKDIENSCIDGKSEINKSSTAIKNEINLKELLKIEKNKNMNYRFEIQEHKKEYQIILEKLRVNQNEIMKLEKSRESDKRYIIKMENLIRDKKLLRKNFDEKKDDYKSNDDVDKIISENKNLVIENTFMKNIVENIFSLSTIKENINSRIILEWKNVSSFFETIQNYEQFDSSKIKYILNHFHETSKLINDLIDIKEKEFNFINKSRNEQFQFLNEEINNLRKEITKLKLDKNNDKKLIHDLENENLISKIKIEEFEYINKNYKKKMKLLENLENTDYNKKNKFIITNESKESKKKVNDIFDKSIGKIEKSLNLNDQINIDLLERLQLHMNN